MVEGFHGGGSERERILASEKCLLSSKRSSSRALRKRPNLGPGLIWLRYNIFLTLRKILFIKVKRNMEIKDYVKNSLQSKATKSSAVTCRRVTRK